MAFEKIKNFFTEETKEEIKESNIKEKQEIKEKLPDCCKPTGKKPSGFLQGLMYGIIPHIGCIAFIIASILGLTVATSFFRPLLMKSYFFYIMIALSIVFATISAIFYLRKQGSLSIRNVKNHKKYLAVLYGSTVTISLLLYFVIFPLVAGSATAAGITGAAVADLNNLNTITLDVAIPCPGHAPLITGDLKKLDGVVKIDYSPIKTFKVYYDPTKISKQEVLGLEVFKEYKATVKDESNGVSTTLDSNTKTTSTGGGCCGGGGSCGSGSGGGCGCGAK